MPELPEVETVRKVLEKRVLNKKIIKTNFFYTPVLENLEVSEFKKNIENQTINKIDRKGKFLLFKLDDYVLLSHLRMEGKYYFFKDNLKEKVENLKHKIFVIHFNDNTCLVYDDIRKFGRIKLLNIKDFMNDKSLATLGEEPFTIKNEELYKNIKKSNRTIKQILLDQKVISGIGNIYVDEILFLSKITPFRKGINIEKKEVSLIIENSIKVLNEAIRLGGSTIKTFKFDNKLDGMFQNKLYVYGRKDEECLVCGSLIKKEFIAKRGTHYCPTCQK